MRILVAIDFPAAAAKTVVSHIASRSWPSGAVFEILHVVDSTQAASAELDQHSRQAESLTGNAAREIQAKGYEATASLIHGHPKAAMVDRAREIAADLIVLGSNNAGGIEKFLLGGVASAVLRHAPCSVELVRSGALPSGGWKILLATDGSPTSLAAARHVAALPWPPATEVRILSAVELSLTLLQSTLEPPYLNSETMEVQRVEAMKRAQDAIRSAEEILAAAGLRTSESISVLIESPKESILKEAREWGADLVVAGSHGRRGLDRFLLGSVSEAVALHAPCSVEVIRS